MFPGNLQFGKEAESPTASWLGAGRSWLGPPPHSHSPRAQATQSGDLGGQKEEESAQAAHSCPAFGEGNKETPLALSV